MSARQEVAVEPSNYQPADGEQFFLLADTGFSTGETATVRLEAPGRSERVAEYGGADIVVYRVPDPMTFLKAQHNLHRIQLQAQAGDEGIANTLGYLWDNWYKSSRLAWQRLFTSQARTDVVAAAPALNQTNPKSYGTRFTHPAVFRPLPGLDVVNRFRYPINFAKPIQPPAGVNLEGSSSDFLRPNEGNVRVPVGKLAPGLYVVEAYIGSYHANTLLFVADTVAVTKISGSQLLVWTADKSNGHPVAGASIAWTDGAGTLASGKSDSKGLVELDKASPEHSYVLGQDAQGGVFVSDNFYYDSEIYATKLYAITDRPLYRPGDEVNVKLVGRQFSDARHSSPLPGGKASVQVQDANGTPLFSKEVRLDPAWGGELSFQLPDDAGPGGYQMHVRYGDGDYLSAFRVAQYVKPQYEINLLLDKPAFQTGDAVTGRVQLNYPDGKPVPDAALSLTLKAQKLSMVDDKLDYMGEMPVPVDNAEIRTDRHGEAHFSLPAATDPSRYTLSILSSDQAAYRVSTTKEVLIQAAAGRYRLSASRQFSEPGQSISFTAEALTEQKESSLSWECIRLEDRAREAGTLTPGKPFSISFARPGSYSVRLLDAAGNPVGVTSHWVTGPGQSVIPGTINIVFDKASYAPGDTAQALITFDQPVDDALLTLERDRVDASALLSAAGGWVKVSQVGPAQWRASIPVRPEYGPNMTFSVLTVRHDQYVFQNRGLLVSLPRVNLAITTDKGSYRPGELVTVNIAASVDGRPVAADLFAGVVDEMVYALQPDTAPDVFDFFYHVRRNNVRTSTSLNFHSYDMALSPQLGAPASGQHFDRPFKVMERPRREDRDTAAWQPHLRTDATGHARFSFRMPDSLTRWRITVRGMTADGVVGQNTDDILSDKPLYLKWIGPRQFRQGDAPLLSVALFNSGAAPQSVELVADGLDAPYHQTLVVKPGANYVNLPVSITQDRQVTVHVQTGGHEVDALGSSLQALPNGWTSTHTVHLGLDNFDLPSDSVKGVLAQLQRKVSGKPAMAPVLPADARNLRLSFASAGSAAFSHAFEDLIDYPWGCVEQTASHMIPLTLALDNLPVNDADLPLIENLEHRLQNNRLRLVQMAGPQAQFSWWGNQTEGSALLSAYAYYADELAAARLHIDLPPDHGQPLLDAYSKYGRDESPLSRAVSLWLMQAMQLPTATLAEGLIADLPATHMLPGRPVWSRSEVMSGQTMPVDRALTIVLLGEIERRNQASLPASLERERAGALATLKASNLPLARALVLLASGHASPAAVTAVIDDISPDYPTIDRSLSLIWLNAALAGKALPANGPALSLDAPWQPQQTFLGTTVWHDQAAPGQAWSLRLTSVPTGPVSAQLSYDSNAPEAGNLPVTLERHFYRLVATGESLHFKAEPVGDDSLRNNELYVDEVVLAPARGQHFRYGLLEVPLPPGADVESTTWGLNIEGLPGSDTGIASKAVEPGSLSYGVPVTDLQGRVVVRHLLRFSQRGRFQLPPSRYWRMYQPDSKAFEGGGQGQPRVLTVR